MVLRYILANIPYTLSEVKLGSLVPNITCPNQDALVPSKQLKEGIDFSWRDQKNFSFTLDQEQSSLIRAQITRLAKLHGHSLNDQHNQLWSKEGRIYELTQPEQLFQELCKDKTIEDSILKRDAEGETLHFVVGLRTFYDATTVDEEVRDSGVMGKTNLPTGEVASGGAATGDILDMGIEGGARSGRRKVESFEIPGSAFSLSVTGKSSSVGSSETISTLPAFGTKMFGQWFRV
ncbi:hypothetical protein H2199_008751 [Coniosporium tulheliwenetii]|uniref:Uncharacterized protein n=1 Tax=Coniosporium tulheliwenetii TaxID=3383036 RepID=A0ACC2YHX5_9PEZI|nr:hypothetical protein H2199_008751 [Cladosporium sp. JES 115]